MYARRGTQAVKCEIRSGSNSSVIQRISAAAYGFLFRARTHHHHYHHPCKNHTHHRREPYHRCSQGCQLSTCCSGAGNDEEEVLLADKQFYQFAAFSDFPHNTNPPLNSGFVGRDKEKSGKTITVFFT